jgi:hypothetical protein
MLTITLERALKMHDKLGLIIMCNDGEPIRVLSEYVEEEKERKLQTCERG